MPFKLQRPQSVDHQMLQSHTLLHTIYHTCQWGIQLVIHQKTAKVTNSILQPQCIENMWRKQNYIVPICHYIILIFQIFPATIPYLQRLKGIRKGSTFTTIQQEGRIIIAGYDLLHTEWYQLWRVSLYCQSALKDLHYTECPAKNKNECMSMST